MLLRNACALLGPRLSLAARADIGESGGTFDRVCAARAAEARRGEEVIDCEGLLAVPALVNAHTHIGDSIAKDAAPGRTVDEKVHPVYGAKPRILARSRPGHLESMMRASCVSMLAGGTTTFADFREGGLEGAAMLARAAAGLPVRPVILGRVEAYDGVARAAPGRQAIGAPAAAAPAVAHAAGRAACRGQLRRARPSGFIAAGGRHCVQYFAALRRGQKRIAASREYLDGVAGGGGGRAMPALALKGGPDGPWEPVGEEDLYAFVDESSGFVLTDTSGHILAIVDSDGYSKAIVQGIQAGERERIEAALRADGVPEFRGKVTLPV